MLKDLTTNELSRKIFLLEHFNHLLEHQLERLNLDWTYLEENKSETNVKQRQDLEVFYLDIKKVNSDIMSAHILELEFRVTEAENENSVA